MKEELRELDIIWYMKGHMVGVISKTSFVMF